MKILIVNTTDISGGAARAAHRLHTSLLQSGVNSQMLVVHKASDENKIIEIANNKLLKIFHKTRSRIDYFPNRLYFNRTKTFFSNSLVPFSGLVKKIKKINPDIVHLHWVCNAMMSVEDLSKIKAPIVWSLHDMWPFTGGCHYDENCGRYKSKCGNCPVLGSGHEKDLSRFNFNSKNKSLSTLSDLTIIGLSKWLANCAKDSTLFKDKNIVNIPNPIDTNIFSKEDKKRAREYLDLPIDKKLILFGSMSATSDERKGYKKLTESLKLIDTKNTELVVFGNENEDKGDLPNFKINFLGNIKDDIKLKNLYNAADVMIVPSLQENLSNAIMESLSSGTPVVAFDIGGNSDMIDHKINGYLAKPYKPEDLARGIEWILEDEERKIKLGENARKKVLENFDSKIVAKQYIDLYKEILEEK